MAVVEAYYYWFRDIRHNDDKRCKYFIDIWRRGGDVMEFNAKHRKWRRICVNICFDWDIGNSKGVYPSQSEIITDRTICCIEWMKLMSLIYPCLDQAIIQYNCVGCFFSIPKLLYWNLIEHWIDVKVTAFCDYSLHLPHSPSSHATYVATLYYYLPT